MGRCPVRRKDTSRAALFDGCAARRKHHERIQESSGVLHDTETRVNVRVIRTEPVAKGGTQQASGGPRRAALHDVVLAIEKIGRVARVKRKRLETGERAEHCGRPLPTIAECLLHSMMARASPRIPRYRIPASEIRVHPRRPFPCPPTLRLP